MPSLAFARFPRTGGDGPEAGLCCCSLLTFPPHRRGWTRWPMSASASRPVSPAQAGMDRGSDLYRLKAESFPRTGGDGPVPGRPVTGHAGFPPHRRGWTVGAGVFPVHLIVSPAQAGMDPDSDRTTHPEPGFPRTGGDGPTEHHNATGNGAFPPHRRGWTALVWYWIFRCEVSPHRRGWTPPLVSAHDDGIVSPAQAGMDPSPL